MESGRAIGAPLLHDDSIFAAQFRPDGRLCATGGADRMIRVWDAATGQQVLGPMPHQSAVHALAFRADSQAVASGSDDNTARVWDLTNGLPLTGPLEHERPVHAVTFHPEGRLLLSADLDGIAQLWDVATGTPVGPRWRHAGPVETAAFSPDGRTALTTSRDRTACLWPVLAPLEGDPARIMLRMQVRTGMELDDKGARSGPPSRGVAATAESPSTFGPHPQPLTGMSQTKNAGRGKASRLALPVVGRIDSTRNQSFTRSVTTSGWSASSRCVSTSRTLITARNSFVPLPSTASSCSRGISRLRA